MAAGTLISRALGLIRVMLIAFILGNGTRQAGILSLATTVPNSLYILFAGGALNTVLVPQIVRAIRNDEDGGEAYTNRIMTAFLLIVGAVAVVVTLAAPVVTQIYSSSEWRSPDLAAQYASMVTLTYLTLPQIFFYGAFFLLGQVLNARDKFGPMMWAPIANNVVSILVLGLYLVVWGNQEDHSQAFSTPQVLLLGIGSTLGIVCQTLVLIPYLRRVGFRFRPRFDLRGTGLGKTFSLTKWTIGFVAVNQLALVVVTRLATTASAAGAGGGVDVYNNAHLVWILPHSLITVSLTTAMLPNASRLAAAGDMASVAEEATRTMRLALIALVPAAVGFMALAGPIAGLLFGHGQGQAGAQWVGWALMAFTVGLIPFTIQFICLRTYYALEDTRTPFLIQVLIAGLNAGLAFVLVMLVRTPGLVAAGLALAYSLAYAVGVVVSWRVLTRRVPLPAAEVAMHTLRLLLGAGLGGVAAFFLARWLTDAMPGLLGNAAAIVLGLGVIGVSYLLLGRALRVRELRNLSDLRLRRRAVPADTDDEKEPSLPPTPPFVDETLVETAINPRILVGGSDVPRRSRRPEPAPSPKPVPSPVVAAPAPPAAPAVPAEPAPALQPRELSPRVGHAGMLLETRFRCDEMLELRDGVESWRAHDLVLSRDVVLHLVGAGDARTNVLLDVARRGAMATDSRFLRVLDAVEVTDVEGVGAMIVSEYAGGRSLTELLADGPLTALESAWLVRELADALSGMHAQGLFHRAITPDRVVVTRTGAVRLVGFGIDAGLTPQQDASWRKLESEEVRALAALLYAMQVARWPFGEGYGLPAAPMVGGVPAGPQVVRPGVSPALDRIIRATLSPQHPDEQIISTAQLTELLDTVLGSTDASADLEHRVRHSPPRRSAAPAPSSIFSDDNQAGRATHGDSPGTDSASSSLTQGPDGTPEQCIPAPVGEPVIPGTRTGTGAPSRAAGDASPDPAVTNATLRTGVSADPSRQADAGARTPGADSSRPAGAPSGREGSQLSGPPSGQPVLPADHQGSAPERLGAGSGTGPDNRSMPTPAPGARAVTTTTPNDPGQDPENTSGTMIPPPVPASHAAFAPPSRTPKPPQHTSEHDDFQSFVPAPRHGGGSQTAAGASAATVEAPTASLLQRLVPWLAVVLVVALITFVAWWFLGRGQGDDPVVSPTTSQATQTPRPTPTAHSIIGSLTFDPTGDGGSGDENPEDAPKAYDGDPSTGWPTMRYKNRPTMGGQKPGVGLILDLGEAKPISAVDLTFDKPGTTVELRVPATEAAEAPMRSQKQWKVLATAEQTGTTATLTAESPTTSRFVMVYVTSLPEVSAKRYLTQINELVVR